MFYFTHKNLITSKALYGMVDYHSHILPGVDDGIQKDKEAYEVLSYFETLGITKVVFTPHISNEYPLKHTDHLKEKFKSFIFDYTGNLELSLSAEYMLDPAFEELLENGELLTIHDKHLLVETSYMNSPVHFTEILTKIHDNGYHTILAHPERYVYMDEKQYQQLKDMGLKFQLNLLSLVGVYGKKARSVARKLLLDDFYDCIGSDLHNLLYFQKDVRQTKLSSKIIRKLQTIKKGLRYSI